MLAINELQVELRVGLALQGSNFLSSSLPLGRSPRLAVRWVPPPTLGPLWYSPPLSLGEMWVTVSTKVWESSERGRQGPGSPERVCLSPLARWPSSPGALLPRSSRTLSELAACLSPHTHEVTLPPALCPSFLYFTPRLWLNKHDVH